MNYYYNFYIYINPHHVFFYVTLYILYLKIYV